MAWRHFKNWKLQQSHYYSEISSSSLALGGQISSFISAGVSQLRWIAEMWIKETSGDHFSAVLGCGDNRDFLPLLLVDSTAELGTCR